jgi:flagellar biosynthesis/type III secretory pathway protein FliH
LADAISAASAAWETALEAGAVEIAYAAVLRIIGQTMCSRDAVVAMVRKVMEQLPERRALSIHLSPSDHALLEADAQLAPLGGVKLVPDERVDIGGCIVETDAGSLDGRLETQLAGLRDLLLSLHRSGGERE